MCTVQEGAAVQFGGALKQIAKASYLRVKNIVVIHAYTKHHFYYVHKGR